MHNKKSKVSCVFYAHSHSQFLCSLARFDLANRGVCQPVQLHTFYARLVVFDKTLAQSHFAVVNCSDALMNVFYSRVLTQWSPTILSPRTGLHLIILPRPTKGRGRRRLFLICLYLNMHSK